MMEAEIKLILGSKEDVVKMAELSQAYEVSMAEGAKQTPSPSGLLKRSKPQYHQQFEFWQLVVLTVTVKTLPLVIAAVKEIIVKFLETNKTSITLEKKDQKLTIDSASMKDIEKLINEDTIRNFITITRKDEEE